MLPAVLLQRPSSDLRTRFGDNPAYEISLGPIRRKMHRDWLHIDASFADDYEHYGGSNFDIKTLFSVVLTAETTMLT